MTTAENKLLVALREKNEKGSMQIGDFVRLGLLEAQKEIEESDWIVDKYGNMEHKTGQYDIPANRLAESWLEHMSGKRWVNMDTFVRAYIRACRLAGIKEVQITY